MGGSLSGTVDILDRRLRSLIAVKLPFVSLCLAKFRFAAIRLLEQ